MIAAAIRWVDTRLGAARFTRGILNKVFPDHWSFLLGEVILYCFLILVGTGVYLTLMFEPSPQLVIYDGSYVPLQGVEMSRAYASALDISFGTRAGLVIRQVHHWAALLFVASMALHVMRTFFTGAFRKPRELNWVVGVTLLVLALVNGFTGYSVIDDQLSGTGLRIGYSIILSIPLIGPWLASLLLGGEFPGPDIISRLFVIHIMIVPAMIAILIVVHMVILVRQKHTQFPGEGRREDNVVGLRLWPTYAAKAVGLFFVTSAVLAALGGLVQINPIWLFGPFRVADVSSASQPDWYLGWLEGALRLMPAWELRASPYEIPNPFYPAALLAGVTFGLLYAWPWLEARFSGDHDNHNLLDHPTDRPVRTAIGVGFLAFVFVLHIAGSDDVLAVWFNQSVNTVVRTLQFLVIVVPLAAGYGTYRYLRRRQLAVLAGEGVRTLRRGHSPWEFRVSVVLVGGLVFATVSSLSTPSQADLPELWTPEDSALLPIEELYRAACAECHGENLEGVEFANGTDGPALGPDSPSVEMSDELIAMVVESGIGDMPALSGVLTEQQTADIVHYIRERQGVLAGSASEDADEQDSENQEDE